MRDEEAQLFSPQPSSLLHTGQNLLAERVVLHGATGLRRERKDRFFVRRTLLEPDRLGDHGVEQPVAEDFTDLGVDVARQRGALVVHGDDEDRTSTRLNSSHLVTSYAVF